MISDQELNLIHIYLEDNLSPEEAIVFKGKFESNTEFAKEVKRYTDIRIALKAASAHRLKKKKKARLIQFSLTRLAIAASFALLIGLGTMFFLLVNRQPFHQQLFAEYYSNPLERSLDPISRSDAAESDPEAMEDFVLAINFMEKQRFAEAIEILQPLLYTADERLAKEAEWYLALCYLQTGEVKVAKDLFLEIINSTSAHSNHAWRIYQELSAPRR